MIWGSWRGGRGRTRTYKCGRRAKRGSASPLVASPHRLLQNPPKPLDSGFKTSKHPSFFIPRAILCCFTVYYYYYYYLLFLIKLPAALLCYFLSLLGAQAVVQMDLFLFFLPVCKKRIQSVTGATHTPWHQEQSSN